MHAIFVALLAMFCVVISNPFVCASDGDSLTLRTRILSPCTPDATFALNAIINKHFELALEKVNRKDDPSIFELERAILDQVGDKKIFGVTIPIGVLEKPIEKGFTRKVQVNGQPLQIPSFTIDRKDSILADARFSESPGVIVGMAAYFRICNLVVGSDKLTHFFAQGHEYIEVKRERGMMAAIEHGIGTENGKYGLSANGIYSFGDLSANFCGLCFWTHLTHDDCGYFKKCNGKWVQVRKFCWRRYINPAWDEGINPSCGPTIDRTKPYVAALVRCGKIPHFPPLEAEKTPTIREFYPEWVIPYILNPKTLALLQANTTSEVAVESGDLP